MPTDEGSTLQLRLSLSSNTSFKRSFQELFGGAESDGEQGDDSGLIGVSHGTTPVGHAGRVHGREGRNKRQRSESQGDNISSSSSASTSTIADSSSGSLASSLVLSPRTSTSGTTDNRIYGRTPTRSSLPNGTQEASLPPRLPTPRLDDVQMSDIPLLDEVRGSENLTHAALQAGAAVASASGSGSEGSTSSHSQRSGVLQEPQHLQRYQQEYQQQYQPRTQHSSSSSSLSPPPSSPSPLLRPSTILTHSNHPTGSTITNLNLDLTQLSNEHAATTMGSLRLDLFSSSPGPVPPSSLSVSGNSSRTGPESEERFRTSTERYNVFESAMAALRGSVSPPPPRGLTPATPPPRLPPLEELQESIRLPEVVAPTAATTTNYDDTLSSPIRHTHTNGFTHANLGLPPIGGDRDHTADHNELDELDELDEGSDDEDRDDEVLLHNHQRLRTRLARADGAPQRDAPPRIELSNSMWSSLNMGGSGRNSTTVVDEERAVGPEMGRQEEQDDLVYPDPSFRDRLDSALEALRSPSSPLVPGFVGADSNRDENLTEPRLESGSIPLPSSINNVVPPQTQIPPVNPLVVRPGRSGVLPTLPPILIDSANNGWRRNLPAPHDRQHLRRVSREEYDRRTLQRLGEVQVPSPSLSGFYDWLEGASANVPTPGTGSESALGSNGFNTLNNAEGQAPSQDQGGEGRSWEEEVLSGFVNTRPGLNLGLARRDREEHVPLPPVVSSPGLDTGQSAVDGAVMDVDMESDAEREREVERLPWTLGSSISSPNHPTSRLNLNQPRRSIQPMPEQYRRLNLLHGDWGPRLQQGRGQTEAGPPTSAHVPLVSENDTSLPSFSSSLFSSPSPPPPQPTASTHLTLLSSTSPLRQTPTPAASRAGLPSSILSPRRSSALSSSLAGYDFVPRSPDVGSTTSSSNRTSLPPSLSLDLGLNNSIFGLSNTSGSDHGHITPNDNNNIEAAVSSEPTQQDSLTNIFEPPPPRTHWRLHEALSAADNGGLRAPTRVLGSSNSLVAENASEMRRRYARAELVRRSGGSQRSSRTFVSNLGSDPRSSLSSSTSAESGPHLNLQTGGSGDGEGIGLNLWGRHSESGSESVTSTRERQVEERGEQMTQPQTQSRFEPLSQSQLQRGNFFGTFGGLGLPPRNSGGPINRGLHANRGSESGSSIASSTGASLYSGVVPPPPRPRLHSVRRVLSPAVPESTGFDSSSDGRRRSTPWSLEVTNTPNVDEGGNASRTSGSRPMTSGEAFITMLGLQLSPDHEHRRRRSLLYLDSESDRDSSSMDGRQLQRNARTSVDSLGSSDSAMSSESLIGSGYGSGVSSTSVYGTTTTASTLPARAMFLDTELPSPGLGELLDTLGSPNANNNLGVNNSPHPNQNPFDLPLPDATGFSPAPLSTPASATTFNSSGSSGYFSPLGRFTPSPVRTSDEDVEVERPANDVRRLGTRFRRTESDNEMLGWFDRGWDEDLAPEAREMDVDGNQRDRYRNHTTNDESQPEVGRRPPLQDPRFTPLTQPLQNDFTLSDPRARNAIPLTERRHIIDPTLFAPGPFRNTMETLAMTARDYAARASSSRAATTMSSPVMPLPSPSSVPSPASQTFAPRSHHSAVHPSSSLSSQGAAAQSPPVIPPLSFENVPRNDSSGVGTPGERTGVRHITGSTTHQPTNERHPALRQGGLGNYLRRHEEQRRREAGNISTGGVGLSPRPTLFGSASSSSSISSSDGMHLSWSHLERSPERSESGASATHPPVTSSSGAASASMGQGRPGGEIEGLQHAIGVMRGDGLSLERSLQFWRGFYRDQIRERSMDTRDEAHVPPRSNQTSQAEVQSRNLGNHNRDRGSRSPHVPRWRYGHQMTPTTSTTTTSTSTTISNNVTGPSPLLSVDRTRSRLSYPSWHDVVLNRPSSMEDVLGGVDSDSADDEDFEALLSLSRPSTAAPVGPRAPRLESFNRLSNRYRLGGLGANTNTNNPGSGPGPSSAHLEGGLGGSSTGRGESDLPHFPRILRERMLPRYRPPPTLGTGGTGGGGTGNGLGTNGGRRFGGFGRRFGNLGDYVNDEDFDASYESLLSLQAALGDVRPRSTPEAVLRRLRSAKYREWADEESDARCPICLEEYAQDDVVMKSGNCKHWLHKGCLEQWLKTANTCPVCRTDVEPRPIHHHPRCPRHRIFPLRREGPGGSESNRNDSTPGSGSRPGGGNGSNNADPNTGRTPSGHSSRFGGGPP